MTADEYRRVLHRLDLSHAKAGDLFGVTRQTSTNYATGRTPISRDFARLVRLVVYFASFEQRPLKEISFISNWDSTSEV